MVNSDIIKLASAYAKASGFVKQANMADDMALRIAYSLIGEAFDHPEEAQLSYERYANIIIPGAERFVKYAAKICMGEMRHVLTSGVYSAFLNKWQIINSTKSRKGYDKREVVEFLKGMAKSFRKDNWASKYGGISWSNFAIISSKILQSVIDFYRSKDAQDKVKYSKEVVVYMNIADGMCHNTGSFIEIWQEYSEACPLR